MKRFKRILFSFVALLGLVFLLNTNVYASEDTTTNLRGFTVSDEFTLVEDNYISGTELTGEKWYYGKQEMWTALYSYYDSSINRKYYIILVSAYLSSNTNSAKNGYYRFVNEDMNIEVKCNSNNHAQMIKYDPESYGKTEITETVTRSLSFNANENGGISIDGSGDATFTAGKTVGLSYTISKSETVYKDNIILVPYTLSEQKGIIYDYVFNNTKNKKINNLPPYRGTVVQRMMTIYEVRDYSEEIDDKINFEINYTGKIRKMACTIAGCTPYEKMGETLTVKYTNRGIQYLD